MQDAVAGQDDRALGRGDLGGRELELAGMAVHVRAEPGQAGDDLLLGGVLGPRLLLEGVLGDVDVDRTRTARAGDVERLGERAGQLVGVADEVVVLGHRQRDAVDVDLLERVLADEGGRHVAGDRDHRDGVQQGGADARDEVRRARTTGPEADADPAGHAGVAVGRVRATLLVADEDVAQLGVVAQDVVERQDDAARVAEEDVDALAEEGLAHDVGADAGPVEGLRLVEHVLAGALDRGGPGRPVGGHVAGSTRRCRRVPRHRHRSGLLVVIARCVLDGAGKRKTPAFRRGSLRSAVFGASAPSSAFLRSPAGSR